MRSLFTAGVARPDGFEPPAFRIGICCDIQLRYGRKSITIRKFSDRIQYYSIFLPIISIPFYQEVAFRDFHGFSGLSVDYSPGRTYN